MYLLDVTKYTGFFLEHVQQIVNLIDLHRLYVSLEILFINFAPKSNDEHFPFALTS